MKILIVDDCSNVLEELPKAFKRFFPEAEIHGAGSYIKAEEFLKENIYEIILLDGSLSEYRMDPWQHAFGVCLIEPIRTSLSCKAKIIMISSDEEMREEGMQLGANLKISKNEFFSFYGKVVNSLDTNLEVREGL